jgi:HPt (histidine-containing phosphotransfer) domain-containing protein
VTPAIDTEQLFNVTLGDAGMVREIADAVIEDTAAQIALLARAAAEADSANCAAVAHSAKGSCGNIGATALAELFRNAERAARVGDLSACAAMIPRFSLELERLRIALDALARP